MAEEEEEEEEGTGDPLSDPRTCTTNLQLAVEVEVIPTTRANATARPEATVEEEVDVEEAAVEEAIRAILTPPTHISTGSGSRPMDQVDGVAGREVPSLVSPGGTSTRISSASGPSSAVVGAEAEAEAVVDQTQTQPPPPVRVAKGKESGGGHVRGVDKGEDGHR